MKIKVWLVALVWLLGLFTSLSTGLAAAPPTDSLGQTEPARIEYVRGTVLTVQDLEQMKKIQGFQGADRVVIRLTSGPETGKEVKVINYRMGRPGFDINPQADDHVVVAVSGEGAAVTYNLADYDRVPYVYVLIGVFVVTLLTLGRKVGLKSLFVICFAIFVILQGMIPLILSMTMNLIVVTLLASAIIALVTQVTVSGWNPKTWGAILGTVGGVAVAGLLAVTAIHFMHLTGLDNEEAIMLKVTYLAAVDFQEVLFAGIVIGSLGAVMDVAISIASAQYEIKQSCPHFGFRDLFTAGLNVGRDVMGTMSNTLILAYIGSALPLVLLITAQKNVPLLQILNLNLIVTEIARTLTGSIGLIFSIPLTALVTAWFLGRS